MSHIDIFIAVWLPSLYMHDFNKSVTFIDFAIRLLGREDFSDEKKKMLIGGEGEERVYLVKSEVLGGKSLLQYIVDNGPRMMKQREDLLDVLAKHVEIVNSDGKSLNEKQIESKIIKNLKLGLPSSTGLAECITMTEEKFPWSSIKARGMIALSVVSNLFSLALYFVDVYTDGLFVRDMSENSKKNFEDLQIDCKYKFFKKTDEDDQFCEGVTENIKKRLEYFEIKTLMGQKCMEIGPRFEDLHKFTECFWYSLVHCITPIFWTVLVFIHTTNTMKALKIRKIPFAPITRFVKIDQDRKKFTMRTKNDFERKVSEIEAEIAEYEDSVNLSSGIEAATEAGPQFFFQTVYFLPNLIVNLVATPEGWKELVSHKMLSIAFSFTSVAVSNYFIRWDLLIKI